MSFRIQQIASNIECMNPALDETTDYIFNETEKFFSNPVNILGERILDKLFSVIRHIGSGGMSDIYLVKDSNEKIYAAKFIKAEVVKNGRRKRFEREIRALLRFQNHPYILSAVTYGKFLDRPVIITEFAEGGSLYSRINLRNLSFYQALTYMAHACEGLHELHKEGFIHRDVKPHNLLIVNNIGKLSDFGLIKELNVDVSSSFTGSIKGTVNYISPEMANPSDKEIDWCTDIYSLGVTMFHVFCGRLPFLGNVFQIIKQHVDSSPPNPCDINKNIPKELSEIILRALSKAPEERPSALDIKDSVCRLAKVYGGVELENLFKHIY